MEEGSRCLFQDTILHLSEETEGMKNLRREGE